MVPKDIQTEVYETVGKRSKRAVDATWAPWWRAQARAIAHVAFTEEPDEEKRARYLERELGFAAQLEAKG